MNIDQQKALEIVGYLYLRLGMYDRAYVLFMAMGELPGFKQKYSAQLALIAMKQKRYEDALKIINQALLWRLKRRQGGNKLTSKDCIFLLLKAQALWSLKRKEESNVCMEQYLTLRETDA